MKIAQTCHHYFPHTGGTERSMKTLVDGLAEKGQEVHVFSDREDLSKLQDTERIKYHGIKLLRISKFRFPQKSYWEKIENSHCDIIHVQGQRVWSSDYLNSKLEKMTAKKLFTAHGFYQMIYPGKFNDLYYHRFMPKFLSKFDRLICLTEHEKRQTLELSPNLESRIRVIPNGVDFNAIDVNSHENNLPKELKEKEFILHCGGLQRNKNVEDILEGMRNLKKPLVLTGNIPNRDYWNFLREKAKSLDVSVLHLGNVTDNVLVSLMKNCSAYVTASKFEAFGMSMIEAAYLGANVIAYETGIASELSKMGILKLASNGHDIEIGLNEFKRKDSKDATKSKLRTLFDKEIVINRLIKEYEDLKDEN